MEKTVNKRIGPNLRSVLENRLQVALRALQTGETAPRIFGKLLGIAAGLAEASGGIKLAERLDAFVMESEWE